MLALSALAWVIIVLVVLVIVAGLVIFAIRKGRAGRVLIAKPAASKKRSTR